MGHGGRTGERLGMETVKSRKNTPVVEENDLWVSGIESLYLVYFQCYYLMLPHCHLGVVVASQTGHPVEPYCLASVEIHSSTSYVNKRWSSSKNQFNW
jgi:hypothetical protein